MKDRLPQFSSSLPLGLLICFASLFSPVKSREYQLDYQRLVDLVRSPESTVNPQDGLSDTVEAMTELMRDYDIDLTAVAKKISLNECINLALETTQILQGNSCFMKDWLGIPFLLVASGSRR